MLCLKPNQNFPTHKKDAQTMKEILKEKEKLRTQVIDSNVFNKLI
jgi:hypothetical protein